MKNDLIFIEASTQEQESAVAALADTIWHECYAELLGNAQIDYMVGKFQSANAIHQQRQNEGYHYYLLVVDNTNIGYLGVQPKDGKLLLSKIYLLAEYRGRGYSNQLFAFATQLAQQWGCHTLWLTVNKGNDRAKAAYTKAGYTIAREQVVDIGGGFSMDDYVFEKSL